MAEEKQSGASSSAQNKLESSKTHARRAAEDLRSAATTMAGDYRDKSHPSLGRREGARSHAAGGRRRLCSRESNEGGADRARNRFRFGSDLPSLDLPHGPRRRESAQSGWTRRIDR